MLSVAAGEACSVRAVLCHTAHRLVPIWNFLSGKGDNNCLSYLLSAFQTMYQRLEPLYKQSSQGHPELASMSAGAPSAGVGSGCGTADLLGQGPSPPKGAPFPKCKRNQHQKCSGVVGWGGLTSYLQGIRATKALNISLM